MQISVLLCLLVVMAMVMTTLAENDDPSIRETVKESLRRERGEKRANKRKRLNRDPTLDGKGKEKVKQYGGNRGKRKADWSADGAAGIIEGDIELARKSRDRRGKHGPNKQRTPEELEQMQKRRAEKKAKRAERRIFKSEDGAEDMPDPKSMSKEERKAWKEKMKAERKKKRKEGRGRVNFDLEEADRNAQEP